MCQQTPPLCFSSLRWVRKQITTEEWKPCLLPYQYYPEPAGSTDSADPCAHNSPTEACSSSSVCSCAIDCWTLKHTQEKGTKKLIDTPPHVVAMVWAIVFISSHGSNFSCIVYPTQCRAFGTAKALLLCLTEYIKWRLKRLLSVTY